MSVSTVPVTIAELIGTFADAPPGRLDEEYRRLAAALWSGGAATDAALPAVPLLLELFEDADDRRRGYLAILLGLLAETEYPAVGGEIATAVRQGLDRFLDLVSRARRDDPLSFALRYLLSHFPGDRERILAAVAGLNLDADDLSRLDRALQELDPDRPVLGRVFPSPAVWTLDEDERAFDQSWIKALTPEQVRGNWENDTHTVFGSTGAKAYWAVRNWSSPAPLAPASIPARADIRLPTDPDTDIFGPHAAAFRCPGCGGRMEFGPRAARCADCLTAYPIGSGILNLTVTAGRPDDADDFQFKLAEMPSMGLFYEAFARPNFLRVSGSNWGDAVTPADEDAYIARHVRPVDGPVLDLAAGAGRWTETLARAVGPERVIALDLNPPMLTVLRTRLPDLPAVLTTATKLPFGDATLGAVLCWNALQAFPDDAPAAIAEVGRCLRPGGTFTFLTFRNSADPIYRHFQHSHRFPQHTDGLRLFEPEEIGEWLAAAGLTVRQESTPGTFVIITARREPVEGRPA